MKWQGTFHVPAPMEVVAGEFADPARMAAHMPGVQIDSAGPDGHLSGTITVAFGPKRLVFGGQAECLTDPAGHSGRILGKGASDQRAARFKVELRWSLSPDGEGTGVALEAEAALQGVLADFARTGGPIVAAALTEEFARRLAADLGAGNAGHAPSQPGQAISGGKLAGAMVRHTARSAGRSITGLFRRDPPPE